LTEEWEYETQRRRARHRGSFSFLSCPFVVPCRRFVSCYREKGVESEGRIANGYGRQAWRQWRRYLNCLFFPATPEANSRTTRSVSELDIRGGCGLWKRGRLRADCTRRRCRLHPVLSLPRAGVRLPWPTASPRQTPARTRPRQQTKAREIFQPNLATSDASASVIEEPSTDCTPPPPRPPNSHHPDSQLPTSPPAWLPPRERGARGQQAWTWKRRRPPTPGSTMLILPTPRHGTARRRDSAAADSAHWPLGPPRASPAASSPASSQQVSPQISPRHAARRAAATVGGSDRFHRYAGSGHGPRGDHGRPDRAGDGDGRAARHGRRRHHGRARVHGGRRVLPRHMALRRAGHLERRLRGRCLLRSSASALRRLVSDSRTKIRRRRLRVPCRTDARFWPSQLDVIWSLLTGRLVREKVDPAVLSAVESQVREPRDLLTTSDPSHSRSRQYHAN
jgi:hypothetical protein